MPAFQYPDIYRNILDTLQIGVSVLDLEKKIVFWSDGAEQITGYSRMDALGHSCTENILLHCDQSKCEMCNEKCPLARHTRCQAGGSNDLYSPQIQAVPQSTTPRGATLSSKSLTS